jgi:hypothetical protein
LKPIVGLEVTVKGIAAVEIPRRYAIVLRANAAAM